MSGIHSELGPELRQLAQIVLDRLDPAVRAAAAVAAGRSGGPGRCQQVWCPVCAVAALVTGEQHPMLTVVAEHSATLLTVVRALVDTLDAEGAPTTPPPDDPTPSPAQPDGDSPAPEVPGRYQHIRVSVED